MIRKYKSYRLSLTILALPLLVAACGDPPSPAEVRQRTSSIASPLIIDGAAAIEAISKHEMLAMIFGGLGNVVSDDVFVTPKREGDGDVISSRPEAEMLSDRSDLTEDAEEFARNLDKFLGEIFTPDRIESEEGGKTTFLITGKTLCGSGSIGRSPSPVVGGSSASAKPSNTLSRETPAYDYDYEVPETKCDVGLELRIDASLVDDGIDLEFRFGDTYGAVLELRLRPGNVKAIVYLPALKKAADDLAALLGEELPSAFPTTLQGTLSASVRKDGEALVAELSIDDPLVIKGQVKGDSYGANLPAARPLLTLRFEDGELSADLNWGAAEAILPANAIFGNDLIKPLTESLRLVLSGMRAKITATKDGKLDVQKLSLGKVSELLLGKTPLARLDFNADAGRSMSMKVRSWNDLPRCELAPKLALKLELAAAKLDPYMDSASPSWANETYNVSLEADENGAPVFVPLDVFRSTSVTESAMPPCDGYSDCDWQPETEPEPQTEAVLQMLQGTLTLQSINNPRTIEVPAGQCLVGVSGGGDDPLAGIAAGACE